MTLHLESQRIHETALAGFVIPEKRERFGYLVKNPRGRNQLRKLLPHFKDWNPDCIVRIADREQTGPEILSLLKLRGAQDSVHVMSSSQALDNASLPISDAVLAVVGRVPGTVISCIPGRLAYFEGESRGDRHLLRLPQRR